MYPLANGLYAPRQQWYVAAWASEVTREPMERWILNEPVAFYRTQSGRAVALQGRCPHRQFPLGKSRVVGDNIECGYHGLTFAPNGDCVRVPSQSGLIARCRVASYPLVERWQWLWIWMGDPEQADPDLIPDHAELGLTDPKYQTDGDSYHPVPGRYMLMHDNLFDLTHFSYLHQTSIASGEFAGAVQVRDQGDNWISSRFDFDNIECPPLYADLFNYHGRINRKFGMKFIMPCMHAGFDQFFRLDETSNGGSGELLGEIKVYHVVTPATLHTAHYFFALGRTFNRDDAAFGQMFMKGVEPVLQEDMTATREIERMLQMSQQEPEDLILRSDLTCVLGRRMFETTIRQEQQEPVAQPGARP